MSEQERQINRNDYKLIDRRNAIMSAAAVIAGMVAVKSPVYAQHETPKMKDAMVQDELAKYLQRLEKQNEHIIELLEKLIASAPGSHGKPLPDEKPDFAKIKNALQEELANPELAKVFKLGGFDTREWMCQVVLLYQVKDIKPFWNEMEELIRTISTKSGIPGRIAGWYSDPDDPLRVTGSILQFGYSYETGYDYKNEFVPKP